MLPTSRLPRKALLAVVLLVACMLSVLGAQAQQAAASQSVTPRSTASTPPAASKKTTSPVTAALTVITWPSLLLAPFPHFSLLTTDLPLLPANGGVYVPGQDLWYLKAGKSSVQSICANPTDSSLYLITGVTGTSKLKRMVRREGQPEQVTTLDTLALGTYVIEPAGRTGIYIWGRNRKTAGVWFYNGKKLFPLFLTTKPLTAFAALDQGGFMVALDRAVLLFTLGYPNPKKLVECDVPIDGLAITPEGRLFVSTLAGIMEAKKNQYSLFSKSHGYLQYLDGELFMLEPKKKQLTSYPIQ